MSAVTHDMTDLQVLTAVGHALYGTGWQRRMPDSLGISRSLLYALVAEERDLSPRSRASLLSFCESEPRRLAEELAGRLGLLASAAAVLRSR